MPKESIIVLYSISNVLSPWEIIHISQDTVNLSISVEWILYFDFGITKVIALCILKIHSMLRNSSFSEEIQGNLGLQKCFCSSQALLWANYTAYLFSLKNTLQFKQSSDREWKTVLLFVLKGAQILGR